MQLRPLARPEAPRYPANPWRRSMRWLRKAAVAAMTVGAFSLGGCDIIGLQPIGPRLAGAAPASEDFTCSAEEPNDPRLLSVPGWFNGSLCGVETAWAAFDVVGEGPLLVVTITDGADVATVAVIAPDGRQTAELGPDLPRVELAREPGRWYLAADPLDPVARGFDWFSGRVGEAGGGL